MCKKVHRMSSSIALSFPLPSLPSPPSPSLQCSYVVDVDVHVPWAPDIEVRQPLIVKAGSNNTVSWRVFVCQHVNTTTYGSVGGCISPYLTCHLSTVLNSSSVDGKNIVGNYGQPIIYHQWEMWKPAGWVGQCRQSMVTGACAVPQDIVCESSFLVWSFSLVVLCVSIAV